MQFTDALAFYQALVSDPTFKSAIVKAYDGYNLIPEEIKDIDVGEVAELVVVQVGYLPKIIGALHA